MNEALLRNLTADELATHLWLTYPPGSTGRLLADDFLEKAPTDDYLLGLADDLASAERDTRYLADHLECLAEEVNQKITGRQLI